MKPQNQTKKPVAVSQQKTKSAQKSRKNIVELLENLLKHKFVAIVSLVIISFVFYSNYSTIFDKKVDLNGDNIIYFSCGKAIAEGKGYTNVMGFTENPHTHFPPGYPLFIASLQKISPNDILFVKKANGFLLWLSLILLFLIVRRISDNTLVALFAAIFTAIQTNILSFATIMMSEMLFIFLSLLSIFLALCLNEKLFLKKGNWKHLLLLGLFLFSISYIYFVRSVGISLMLAMISWFGLLALFNFVKYLKTRKKEEEIENSAINKKWFFQHILICFLIAFALISVNTLWNVRQNNAGMTKSSSYEGVFMQKLNGKKMETLDDWKIRLKMNITCNIARYVPSTLFFKEDHVNVGLDDDVKLTSTEWIRGIAVFLVMIAGLLFLKKKSFWLILFYIGIYMITIFLFPEQYQGTRYLIPVIPFFIFLFFNGLVNIVRLLFLLSKNKKGLIPQIVTLCVCVFLMYPVYIKAQDELRKRAEIKSWENIADLKIKNYISACTFCKDSLPDTIRVIARKPELFYMFSGYKKSESFPWYASTDSIISYLKNKNATHIIIDNLARHAAVTLGPAVQANPEKFKVLKEIGKLDTAKKDNPTYIVEFNDEWGYHGEYKDGKKSGEGYELYKDGRKYVGHFNDSKFDGYGVFYDKNGDVVVKGQWRDSRFIKGEGTLMYQNGNRYVGKIDNELPNGNGTLFDAEGKIIAKGQWRNGMFIEN